MARRIPGHRPGSIVAYEPQVFVDKSAPPEVDPLRVRIRAPSQADKRDYMYESLETAKELKAAGKELGFRETRENEKLLIERFVVAVENYYDEAGEPISDAKGLVERGESAVCSEVHIQIMGLLSLTSDEKKDSAASSDSSPQETQASIGTADNAAESQRDETATVPQILNSGMLQHPG